MAALFLFSLVNEIMLTIFQIYLSQIAIYQRFYTKYRFTDKEPFQNILGTALHIYLLVIPHRLIPNNEQMNRQENRKRDCMNDRK